MPNWRFNHGVKLSLTAFYQYFSAVNITPTNAILVTKIAKMLYNIQLLQLKYSS